MIITARKHLKDELRSAQEEYKGHMNNHLHSILGQRQNPQTLTWPNSSNPIFPANSISSQAQIYNIIKQHNSGASVTLPNFSMQS
jgi:hypothetical protein